MDPAEAYGMQAARSQMMPPPRTQPSGAAGLITELEAALTRARAVCNSIEGVADTLHGAVPTACSDAREAWPNTLTGRISELHAILAELEAQAARL